MVGLINRKEKRGQVEMIGLVIVVILIVIGGLFYVKFGINDKKEKKEDASIEIAKATNLMIAVINLKVCESSDNTEGKGRQIADVIDLCAHKEGFCGKADACEYLKEELKSIFKVMEYKNYEFWVMDKENRFFSLGECYKGVESGSYVISGEEERYEVHLKVC